jgi:hypothetical protein
LLYSSKLLVVVNKTVTPIEAEYRAACPGGHQTIWFSAGHEIPVATT